ncbi:MAG: ribosome maturation factor RimP [Bacillota bacterium]
MGKITEEVSKIAEPIVENEGLELVDLEYVKEGGNYYLRLFIDDENGIGLDECEKISRHMSEELDRLDPIKENYILEVSSPGIERPLKTLKDFDRFEGSFVTIKTYAPIDGEKEFIGDLMIRNDSNIRIKIRKDDQVVEIPYSSIAAARLTMDF